MPLDTANERLCDDCGAPLIGRYCHACGEDSQPPRRELRFLIQDGLDNVFSFTEHVPTTLRDLALDPGRILRGLRDGDRKRYLTPFKLYVAASVVFFLFLAATGVSFFQVQLVRTGPPPAVIVDNGQVAWIEGFRINERFLVHRSEIPNDPAVVKALDSGIAGVDPENASFLKLMRVMVASPEDFNDLVAEASPVILWVLMPIYALLLWPLYRRGTLVADHLIFALWAHTSLFLLLILGALWNFTGLGGGLMLALLAYQAYLTVGLKGYYQRGWAGAVVKGALHSLVYFGLVWLPTLFIFLLVQAFQFLPAGYFFSE